ncbi:MAG TPA: ImmA/IrrE family metallo-endopeptidase [Gemmataceae bacterium]|jgi:Zn-dependent peptidase ImmA (M78 family)|nr:ImmA/IrrE family metallo-endopeptidase [Gemmataceae bacterium]
MNQTILDAKGELEAAGLEVKPSGEGALWIAATTNDAGGGIRLSTDASTLLWKENRWVAVFPADGMLNYEVPGELYDLLPMIRGVYTRYRRLGGPFKDAFRRSVPNPESYLVGRYPREDRQQPSPTSRRMEIGTDEGLRLRIDWSGPIAARTASELTRGKALLWMAGELVWGGPEGTKLSPVELTWIDFLDFLARVWPYLQWEEGYPLGLQPREPSLLRAEAKARWQMQPEDRSCEEERDVSAFEERHNLAQGFQSKDLPFVRLVREGNQMWLDSQHGTTLRPATEVLEQLSAIGDAITGRVASSGDARARDVTERWHSRELQRPMELAAIATGLSAETIRWVVNVAPSESPQLDVPQGEFQLTEVLAAARQMIGSLEPETVNAAIAAIAGLPKVATPRLDRLSEEAEGLIYRLRASKPYVQGYTLAGWFRTVFGMGDSRSLEPEELLKDLDVLVREIDTPDDLLDALACWGLRHGPAVVLNKSGKHAQTPPGRRTTLAHELGHLLIDRAGALPLAEVLNGRAPWRVEARARAFAAELLLPRKRAEEVSQGSSDISQAVEELRSEYTVSREVAVWQILNARPSLSRQQLAVLETMVSSIGRLFF